MLNDKTIDTLKKLYPTDREPIQRVRAVLKKFEEAFCYPAKELFSSPGRTEVGGNHTDHNHGRVLAASVNLDILCAAAKTDDGRVRIASDGFTLIELNVDDTAPKKEEEGKSISLVRGIINGLIQRGYDVGGFDAFTSSNVLKGSGLSSSAAFEVLIACVLSHMYNDGKLTPTALAIISREAENDYFKKPCGLMDQLACATGGFVSIDFADDKNPVIEPIVFDFNAKGHTLCIVDVRAGHQGLTAAYAAIPNDMRSVARVFNKSFLREVDKSEFFDNLSLVRESCTDRAILRAMHFFAEDERAYDEAQALKNDDFPLFLSLVNESGRSSYMYLQNIYVEGGDMSLCLGLAGSDAVLKGKGAFRVHGGGFAGTLQAIVPDDILSEFRTAMNKLFGKGSCNELIVREKGAFKIADLV